MIKHIVLLDWKEGIAQEKITEFSAELQKLSSEIPEIKKLEFGSDLGIFEANADYALIAEFESEADFMTYVAHPRHQELLQNVTGPITESFKSAQFKF